MSMDPVIGTQSRSSIVPVSRSSWSTRVRKCKGLCGALCGGHYRKHRNQRNTRRTPAGPSSARAETTAPSASPAPLLIWQGVSPTANVVKDAAVKCVDRLGSKTMYAGVLRSALLGADGKAMQVQKCAAHVEVTPELSGRQRWLAISNDHADREAKRARLLHPEIPSALLRDTEAQLKQLDTVARTIAVTLPHWPRLPHGLDRLPSRPSARPKRAKQRHTWQCSNGVWRCTRCWAITSVPQRQEACGDVPRVAKALAETSNGHACAVLSCETGRSFVACLSCGAWGSSKAINLRERCQGFPSHYGKGVLGRLKRGLHPNGELCILETNTLEHLRVRPAAVGKTVQSSTAAPPPAVQTRAQARLEALRSRLTTRTL